MKKIILLLAMGIALTTQTLFAQVPSYVPTNGLVGYWPFNGNANDESGNGNNGTVNGATLTTDRFGNINSAYNFDGINDYITCINNNIPNQPTSISVWVFQQSSFGNMEYICLGSPNSTKWGTIASSNNIYFNYGRGCLGNGGNILNTTQLILGNWIHLVYVSTGVGGTSQIYKNGILIGQNTNSTSVGSCSTQNLYFGVDIFSLPEYINGKLDDVGIWNRSLNQQEITNLYNSANSTECLTMVINTGALSTNPVTYTSTVNIYPNPTNDQITIDCGNLANVVGWNIKITNMLGQEVFNQPMNTQQYVVPLNSWTGQGMYFVKIINAQNEVVNIKKIILQ